MQDQNSSQNTNPVAGNAPVAQGTGDAPKVSVQSSAQPGVAPKVTKVTKAQSETQPIISREEYIRKIGEKIRSSENILVALSRNPSVDEMSAAIGLTLFLDDLQKHTTAIYSGKTPDALEFLRPESTFETNTASLQDFIIALNKEKADHLRYKLEGDFVKVFITPYKTTITEKDLEFSHGDYNVDLVLALNVPNAADLDEALSEYGRIMHNATTVDITVSTPGRFGEIEWSDPTASSVSEMVADLIFDLSPKDGQLDQEIATALLTGIVAATQRFSNDRTSATALQLASKLMSMGADQQLISANVLDNKIEAEKAPVDLTPTKDASNLAVDHTEEMAGMEGAGQANVAANVAAGGAAEAANPVMTGMDQVMAQPMVAADMIGSEQMTPGLMPDGLTGVASISAPGIDATMTMSSPEPPKDYAQMMAEALAGADANQNTMLPGTMAGAEMNGAVDTQAAPAAMAMPVAQAAPIEGPPSVMPAEVAQSLPSAEQLVGQNAGNIAETPEQGQIGQTISNVASQTEQTASEIGLPMPPENGEMTGPEANPPVLPDVQVPVDLPELPKEAPAQATPPGQSSAFQIPGMG